MNNQAPLETTSTRQAAKLSGAIHYYGADCPAHGHVMRYASNGMCIKCQREATIAHRIESGEQAYPAAYYAGRISRSKGRKKQPPAIMSDENRSWWYAGWNDRDIEFQARKAA